MAPVNGETERPETSEIAGRLVEPGVRGSGLTRLRALLLPADPHGAFLLGTSAILLTGLAYHVLFLVLGSKPPFGGDVHDGYLELARSLVQGHGYVFEPGGDPVMHRPPAYPFLLIPIVLLPSSAQHLVLSVVHATFVGIAARSIFQIAAQWFGDRRAIAAVWIFLANPWLHWGAVQPMIPIFQLAIYTVFLSTLWRSQEKWQGASWLTQIAWIGLCAAAAALTHGAMLYSVVLVILGTVAMETLGGSRTAGVRAALVILLMALAIAPWSFRNWVTFDRLILVTSNAGFAYFTGSAHWGHGELSGQRPPEDVWGPQAGREALYMTGTEGVYEDHVHFFGIRSPALNERLDAMMVEHAAADPLRLIRKLTLNGLEYWWPIVFPLVQGGEETTLARAVAAPGKLVRSLYYAGLWAIALLGLARIVALQTSVVFRLALGLVAFAGPYLPMLTFAASSMYNFGTLPLLAIAGALALARPDSAKSPRA